MNSKTEMRNRIAKILVHLRGEKKQREIAQSLEMKLPTYQALEEARVMASVLTLKKVVRIYGLLNIDELLDSY